MSQQLWAKIDREAIRSYKCGVVPITLASSQVKADRLCFSLLLGGSLFFILMVGKRYLLPWHLAHPEVLNTVCTVGSSVLFTAMIFQSLHDLFTEKTRLRRHFLAAFAGGILLLLLFLTTYWNYDYVNRALIKFESAPNRFPEIVEAQKLTSDAKLQESFAQSAFDLYGIRLAYQRGAAGEQYYMPSTDDLKLRSEVDNMNASLVNLHRISLGLLGGLADIVVASFLTFFVCISWTVFRLSAAERRH